jgi:hypothetical protein
VLRHPTDACGAQESSLELGVSAEPCTQTIIVLEKILETDALLKAFVLKTKLHLIHHTAIHLCRAACERVLTILEVSRIQHGICDVIVQCAIIDVAEDWILVLEFEEEELILTQLERKVASELLWGDLAEVVAVKVLVIRLEYPSILPAHVLEVIEQLLQTSVVM